MCTCFHSCMKCYQYFLFFLVFPCLSATQGSTTATGHQSKESPSTTPSFKGTTTLFYTNMTDLQLRTLPQRETPANMTTPHLKSTTQLTSTTMITNQKSEGAASQEAGSTTRSQQTAGLKPSKSTTKQQSTAGRSQLKMALVGFVVLGCVRKQWLH